MKPLPPVPKNSLKIGLVQMSSGDELMVNVRSALVALNKLSGQSCDLICFPENALYLRLNKKSDSGAGAVNLKEDFWQEFRQFATAEKCAVLIGSVALKQGKKCSNAMVIIEPGKKPKAIYEKIHLFDVDVKGAPSVRESENFTPGKKPQLFKFRNWNIGLSICYDLRFSELYSGYAKKNVHLILVPAAFLVPTGRAHWQVLLRARAIESQAFVVAAAQSGGHRNARGETRETYGHSLVVNPWGEIQGDLGNTGLAIDTFVLHPQELQKVRAQIPMAHHRRL